jgi:transketolase
MNRVPKIILLYIMTSVIDYQKLAKDIRRKVIKMTFEAQSAHVGSALSCVEILTALYFKVLSIDPKHPNDPDRDRFILSKGHAVAALYATLAERGFFNKEILKDYCRNGSHLPGHPVCRCVPGIEVSAGSLGDGLSIANGMALAGKKDGKKYRVFVLLGDGECDEGSIWEAMLFAGHHKLDNLVAIVDYNKWQACGRTKDILDLEPFVKKWQDFGWAVKEVDGHNLRDVLAAFESLPFQKGMPSAVIAHTIKAKGLPSLEDKLISHYLPPSYNDYRKIIENDAV